MSNEPRFRGEIFIDKVYDKGIPNKDDLVVIDIGGHVGLFVEYILPKAKAIYTIEPYKPLYDKVIEKFKDNKKVKAFNIAIAKETGERTLYINGGDGGSSLKYEGNETVVVPSKSLKDFIQEQGITHIDVLKVDCEGGEDEILNSPEFQELIPMIDNIVGEVHSGIAIDVSLIKAGYKFEADKGIFTATKP